MANRDNQKLFRNIALSIFFLFIVGFAFFGSHNLVFGVKIKEINIENGATVTDSIEHITGNAKNAVVLTLNGREISIDKEGNFNETIALSPGYNIVSIEAKDKFGSRDHKDYQLIYKK
jgi:hypothetical protein